MESKEELILMLEELSANTWPAAITRQLGAWRLRATNGVTKRANSVHAIHLMPSGDEWYDEIIQFYQDHHLPVRFHVSDASPIELNPFLDHLGYSYELECLVQIAASKTILQRLEPSALNYEMIMFDKINSAWLDTFLKIEGFHESKKDAYSNIMSAIAFPTCYIEMRIDQIPVAIGTAVVERGWAGLVNIAVHPEFRQRGAASEIVRSLAQWSRDHGAENIYLQVVAENLAAIKLYKKAGFETLYEYNYRALPKVNTLDHLIPAKSSRFLG